MKVEKNVRDYYPRVKTVSALVLPDGSVEVKGEIISTGSTPITHVGFCFDTLSTPKMLDNQEIADLNGNLFSAVYSEFKLYTRYYFRTWASNGSGYSYGNIIYLDSIEAANVIAPCSLAINTIDYGLGYPPGNFNKVTFPEQATLTWKVQAYANSSSFDFYFGSFPKTKVYTTTTSSSPGSDEVQITIYSNYLSEDLKSGNKVYVKQKNSNLWEITICDYPWNYYGTEVYMSAHFTCPL